ncbi:MAG: conjugal transfer protein TraI [Alphaproteobacteria bacterium HGW-Alphaproteobacteria-18]|nr:MAG: conjugal transfer protein TraI [Alphaproteobacteria bacterium HGW-Alphaproteobacteria-18]
MTDDFKPRLGRLGNRGRGGTSRYSKQVRQAAARLGRSAGKARFTGAGLGRGGASARALEMRGQRMASFRMRRVIVKTHVSRAPRGGGGGALKAHLGYIQRDGVERDGSGGELYTREGLEPKAEEFLRRCDGDRHQFRIIVSAEDGAKLGDLKETTRALMAQMESDLGTRLDWLAVDHHNTGHPHTHIVIRGKDEGGRDLVIAPDYIRQGLATRAQDIVTERLGPRRDLEIAQARQREVTQERFTGLDRGILADTSETGIRITRGRDSRERFNAALRRARLRHLEGLGLAVPAGRDHWTLKPGWDASLKALGHRGDILKALAAKNRDQAPDQNLRRFEPGEQEQEVLLGSVLTSVPEDELRDRRSLVVEDFHGTRWIVDMGLREPGTVPPDGAIVEVHTRTPKLREMDASILNIAERSGGMYSDAMHRDVDPASTSVWRQGHVRRLEAMRQAGIVERGSDGVWQLPLDFARRAADYDAARTGRLEVQVRSWLPLTEQARHAGLTWLDGEGVATPGERLAKVRQARLTFLQKKGWLESGEREVGEALRHRLRAMELRRASSRLASSTGRAAVELVPGDRFEGRFEKAMDLGQGRMAVVGNAREFALVPWRPEMERQRGRDMAFRRTAAGVSWTIGMERGLER